MTGRIASIVLLVAAGLVGGALSNVLLRGAPALAQAGQTPSTVTARSFCLVDSEDNLRAALRTSMGSPSLALYDRNGRARAELSTLIDGSPRLILRDSIGEPRAKLSVLGDGSPSISLLAKGMTRAELRLSTNGTPTLLLMNKTGGRSAEVAAYDSGPAIFLMDDNGTLLWRALQP